MSVGPQEALRQIAAGARLRCTKEGCLSKEPASMVLVIHTTDGLELIPLCMTHVQAIGDVVDALVQQEIFGDENDG